MLSIHHFNCAPQQRLCLCPSGGHTTGNLADFVCQYLLSSPSLSSAGYRSTHSLIKVLEERKLEFLYPLKVIQKELSSLLQANTNTVGVYKWIKTNVDPSLYSDPEFVAMLTTWCVCVVCVCLCAHVSKGEQLCQ